MLISLSNPYWLNKSWILRCIWVVPLNSIEPDKAGPNARCSLICMSSFMAMAGQFLRVLRASYSQGSQHKYERTHHIWWVSLQTLSTCTYTIMRFPVFCPALHLVSTLSCFLAVLSTVIQTWRVLSNVLCHLVILTMATFLPIANFVTLWHYIYTVQNAVNVLAL